jgi:hypothetical protein
VGIIQASQTRAEAVAGVASFLAEVRAAIDATTPGNS